MRHNFGDVDMFGLDEFGEPTGMPGWAGALIGSVAAAGTTVAVRAMSKSPTMLKHAEGVGMGASLVAGGVMWAMGARARHAGVNAAIAGAANNGVRWLADLFGVPGLHGLSMAEISRTKVLYPNMNGVDVQQIGITTMEPTGVLGASGLPQLVGEGPQSQRRATATLVGVPNIQGPLSALASNFGATVMGGH